MLAYIALITAFLLSLYLWHVNRALSGTPDDVASLAGKPYTKEFVRETYERIKKEPIDFKKALPPKTGRRYIITGGTGMYSEPPHL